MIHLERVRRHRFTDLATPPARSGGVANRADAGEAPDRVDRRNSLPKAATTVAAVTGMAPAVPARNVGPGSEPTRYAEPDVADLGRNRVCG